MEAKKNSGKKVKQVILAVAIAIIFSLFVGFGISVFSPSPKWDDFCQTQSPKMIGTQEACESAGGNWNTYDSKPVQRTVTNEFTCTRQDQNENPNQVLLSCSPGIDVTEIEQDNGYCDTNTVCNKEYNTAREKHDKMIFIVTLIIGIITIIVSVMLNLTSVSTGLMAGGIITIIYGVIRYWEHSTDILRFIIFGIILAILIWLGYKKLNK